MQYRIYLMWLTYDNVTQNLGVRKNMNSREALKGHVATCMLEGKMTVKEGAERLGLSERQVKMDLSTISHTQHPAKFLSSHI